MKWPLALARVVTSLALASLAACADDEAALTLPPLEIDGVSACSAPFSDAATLRLGTHDLRLPMAVRNRRPWSVTPLQVTATFAIEGLEGLSRTRAIPVTAHDEDAALEDVEIRLLEAMVLDAGQVASLRAAFGSTVIPDAVTLVVHGIDGYGTTLASPPVTLDLCDACLPSCNVR